MSFFEELKRRNVVRVSIAYVLISWLLLSVADFGLDLIDAPNWVIQTLFLIAVIGLPGVMIFSWIFEMTPEGLKKESEIDRSQSITPVTGQKLNRTIIGLLVLVAAYFIWESRFATDAPAPMTQSANISAPERSSQPEEPVLAGSTAPLNSIAVLPFANRSNQETDLFFTDGIHDDLLTQLAKLEGMKVISRTSVMGYRGTEKKISEIASELNVGAILEGGVQRAGSRIRINAQLIDVTTDEHLWAETFDREMTMDNIFDIQSEITRQIVSAVRGQLTDEEQNAIAEQPTQNLAAWESYLKARAILRAPEYSPKKFQAAEPWAQLAVEQDPEFANAWAMLAEIQMQGVWIGYENTLAQRELARQSLERATELAPESAMVIAANADYLYRVDVDYAGALELYEKALEKEPGNATILYAKGTTQRRLGQWRTAIESYRKSLELDPADARSAETMIETLVMMREWGQVIREADYWQARFPGSGDIRAYKAEALIHSAQGLQTARAAIEGQRGEGSRGSRNMLSTINFYERDFSTFREQIEALEQSGVSLDIFRQTKLLQGASYLFAGERETGEYYLNQFLEEALAREPVGDIVTALLDSHIGLTYALLGDAPNALRYARQASQRLPRERDHVFGGNIANRVLLTRAMAGEREQVLEEIERSLGQPMALRQWDLYLNPSWDFFRDDPRFVALTTPPGAPERSPISWKQDP